MKKKRIKALRTAVEGLELAEQKHDGYNQCYYTGIVNRMKHLLMEEHEMTRAQVDAIGKKRKIKGWHSASRARFTSYLSSNTSVAEQAGVVE